MKISARLSAALLLAAVSAAGSAAYASLTFSGNDKKAISESPNPKSGLQNVYVVYNTSGVTASYTASSSAASVTWKRFSTLGGGYAEDVPFTRNGAVTSVTLTADDMGYIVEEGGRQNCYYIINYANHHCSLENLEVSPESDCTSTALQLTGDASRIDYYSVTGAPYNLSRDLKLEYNTLEYNADTRSYQPVSATENIAYVGGLLHCTPPLRDTEFTLSGDRFLREWGEEEHAVSPTFATNAVAAMTWADQTVREADNEQNEGLESGALGGSAPAEITFGAAVTDAVVFREWQFARDEQFDLIDMRVNEDETTRTFTEYGTTYVRFVCGNAEGTCDYTSETYRVDIGESRLECPNAFSPNDDGVNDEWKVSYKSLIDFDCHIFNRWGLEMAHFTDPSQGWDGRYNGKKVPSGAYYYVIQATGSDGRKYKKSGDINIIGTSLNPNGTSSGESPSE